ncbi:Holliday junction resolvase RuvX [Aureibacillus halotolerans]|uniref:Putative pre-16S rRNA nuclease n=1 Tax=Aureibacillus halotolerans TaxID=1508390 RepID=A0A4R6TYR8_9BACI|nr:Holliday junction resolvase RuvX [Aureibacillus halotolerans]TDQ38012.1 putative Holliday junction resolvase [Aureibacillus halotolerans]
MKRLLGIDVGTKTIGLAVSDELGWTAQGVETIASGDEQPNVSIEKLKTWIAHYDAEKIVCGWPKNMNGTIGPRAQSIEAFSKRIEQKVGIPVVLWDERLTTVSAEKMLISADVRRNKRKLVIDKMAAVLILQSYLDAKGSSAVSGGVLDE